MNDFELFVQSKVNRGLRANAWRIAVLLNIAAVLFGLAVVGPERW